MKAILKQETGFALGLTAVIAIAASSVASGSAQAQNAPAPAAAPASAPAAPDDQAIGLLRSVEKRYAETASLTCNFRQSYRSAATGQELVEEGRIWVKRPGRMRWDYRAPEKKVFLVEPDGTTLSYVPSDVTAVRDRLPPDAPHLRLLLGTGGLGDSFTVTGVKLKDALDPGAQCLKLVPREAMPSLEWAYLEIDPASLAVGRVLVVDGLGNESDLVFSKVRENASVKDDVFELRLPAGITVRDATGGGAR